MGLTNCIARPMPADDIPEWVSGWKVDDTWKTFELTFVTN
ncbi:MAG: hypothetical protein ACJAZT_000750 [Gammaproteobacteria bacterium]|jgi:hypothetical protein